MVIEEFTMPAVNCVPDTHITVALVAPLDVTVPEIAVPILVPAIQDEMPTAPILGLTDVIVGACPKAQVARSNPKMSAKHFTSIHRRGHSFYSTANLFNCNRRKGARGSPNGPRSSRASR